MIKKVKNTIPWTYAISDLNGKEVVGTFYEKESQKTNQEKFMIEKVIKKKSDNGKVVNIYIAYKINRNFNIISSPTL